MMMQHGAAAGAGRDARLGRRGEVEAVAVGVGGAEGGFEGAEAEDARDERPQVRHVGDDDGRARLPGVPV